MSPEKRTSWMMLGFNTFAFTVCFAWRMLPRYHAYTNTYEGLTNG